MPLGAVTLKTSLLTDSRIALGFPSLLSLPDPVRADGVEPVRHAHVLGSGRVVDVQVRPRRALGQVDPAEGDLVVEDERTEE